MKLLLPDAVLSLVMWPADTEGLIVVGCSPQRHLRQTRLSSY